MGQHPAQYSLLDAIIELQLLHVFVFALFGVLLFVCLAAQDLEQYLGLSVSELHVRQDMLV